jgi:hypothetical protein
VDPISDPDTATLEMLRAAYGHPNYSRQDLQNLGGFPAEDVIVHPGAGQPRQRVAGRAVSVS